MLGEFSIKAERLWEREKAFCGEELDVLGRRVEEELISLKKRETALGNFRHSHGKTEEVSFGA